MNKNSYKMKKQIHFQRIAYLQQTNTLRNERRYIRLWLDEYNKIENLPDITRQTFDEWVQEPVQYFENQVKNLKEKQDNGLVLNDSSFREMYNLYFTPPSQRFFNIEYFKMDKDGEIIQNKQAFDELKENYTVYTSDPVLIEKLESIENLIKDYRALCSRLNIPNQHDFKELYWNESEKQFDAIVLSKL